MRRKAGVVDKDMMPLVDVAQRLRLTYGQTWNRLLAGLLTGRKVRGYWYVERQSVDRFEADERKS